MVGLGTMVEMDWKATVTENLPVLASIGGLASRVLQSSGGEKAQMWTRCKVRGLTRVKLGEWRVRQGFSSRG